LITAYVTVTDPKPQEADLKPQEADLKPQENHKEQLKNIECGKGIKAGLPVI
jgi:hypothetical protein